MGIFDGFGKKISDVGQNAMQGAQKMADIARINSMITEEERKMNNTYYQIGKLYVSMFGNECSEEFIGMINTVIDCEQKIQEYRKQVQEMKGVRRCPNCGAEVANDVSFCSSCGTPMPKVVDNMDDYIKCNHCGTSVKKGMRFCTECGKPIAQQIVQVPVTTTDTVATDEKTKLCPKCGTELTDDSVFCMECGTKL